MQYLVSVIMPAFNTEGYIKEAIQSVINQTYRRWELLIINDGSIDNTEKIALSFIDNRIRYFTQENKGVSSARNIGLRNMQGKYFCFLDADDSFPKKSIEKRLNVFNEQTAFVDGKVDIMNSSLSKKIKTWTPTYKGPPLNELISLSGSCFFGPSWMIKTNPIRNYKFNENLTHGEDLLFYINISNDGLYSYISETILNYRTGHNSAMDNIKGLEEGYFIVLSNLFANNNILDHQLIIFKNKIKIILFKSYLKKWSILSGLKILFRNN